MAPRLFLKAGDLLLYQPVTMMETIWCGLTRRPIAHLEVYDGHRYSLASRRETGVGLYPMRLAHLAWVLRPAARLDVEAGRAFVDARRGMSHAQVSAAAAAVGYLRAAGWDVFPGEKSERIAPCQFLELIGKGCSVVYEATAHLDT